MFPTPQIHRNCPPKNLQDLRAASLWQPSPELGGSCPISFPEGAAPSTLRPRARRWHSWSDQPHRPPPFKQSLENTGLLPGPQISHVFGCLSKRTSVPISGGLQLLDEYPGASPGRVPYFFLPLFCFFAFLCGSYALLMLLEDDNQIHEVRLSPPCPSLRTLRLRRNRLQLLDARSFPSLKFCFIDENENCRITHLSDFSYSLVMLSAKKVGVSEGISQRRFILLLRLWLWLLIIYWFILQWILHFFPKIQRV